MNFRKSPTALELGRALIKLAKKHPRIQVSADHEALKSSHNDTFTLSNINSLNVESYVLCDGDGGVKGDTERHIPCVIIR